VVKQIGTPTEIYEQPVDDFVARFIGHINFLPCEVVEIREGKLILRTCHGELQIRPLPWPVSVGDTLKAVVRPESIDIVAADERGGDARANVITGRVEVAMYIGAVIRYTVSCGEQMIYVDRPDPQHGGIIREGKDVILYLKDRIHMLRM
jgi:ABC-type Fe3+/spermidine/putrescine transport system ATPase subunit